MTKTKICLLILCLLLLSCQQEECYCEVNEDMIAQNASTIDSVLQSPGFNFTKHWKQFNEPLLHLQKRTTYRLAIIILLADYYKIYRVDRDWNSYSLHVKEYATATTTDYRPDSLVSSFSKEISKEDWLGIENAFKENCFWTMPVDIKADDNYLDGSGWLLEGSKRDHPCTNSGYHFVHRNSPDSSAFRMICEQFMKLDSLVVRKF